MTPTIHDREWSAAKLSEREKLFLLEFAQTQDLVLSARKAGYSESVVGYQGKVILAKPEAKGELLLIREEIGAASPDMTKDEIVEEFKIIATATITDFYDEFGNVRDVTEFDPEKAKAIKEIKRTVHPKTGAVTVTLTMHDKINALQNLGRIGGHYAADNGQLDKDVNIQIVVPGGLGGL